MVRLTHPLPKRLFKYVDEEHAEAVAKGSVKFGNFRKYKDLENCRQDSLEGRTIIEPTMVSLAKGEGGPVRQGLAEVGFLGDGAFEMHGDPGAIRIEVVSQEYVCYCLSLVPNSPSLLGSKSKQAVFEIEFPESFFLRLMQITNSPYLLAREVAYEKKSFKSFEEPGFKGGDAFRKEPVREDGYRFCDECEYRLLFPPDIGIRTDRPYKRDATIRYLMNRIA